MRPSHLPQWLVSIPALIARSIGETPTPSESFRVTPVRVLRSVFRRGDESLTCELVLDHDGECYELRTLTPLADSLKGLEKFCSVSKAFDRQSEIEAALVKDGWTLESHESILM